MSDLALERHYTTSQVAELWGVSMDTIRRMFQDEPGVLRIAYPQLTRRRKPRTTLRIPESVLARLHQQRSGGFLAEVQGRRGGIK